MLGFIAQVGAEIIIFNIFNRNAIKNCVPVFSFKGLAKSPKASTKYSEELLGEFTQMFRKQRLYDFVQPFDRIVRKRECYALLLYFAKVYFRQHFWNENSKISMFNWYFILELGGSETVWK